MPFIDTDLAFFPKYRLPSTTPFTEVIKSPNHLSLVTNSLLEPRTMPSLRHERPALLITSTSWTPDEDFSMLLEALRIYEVKAKRRAAAARTDGTKKLLPKVLMFVTGKGPLRAHYMREIQRIKLEEKWEWVRCMSLWLEADDYPRLLGKCSFFHLEEFLTNWD